MSKFDSWYKKHSKKHGLDPNPDHPLHYYDYRSAHRAGAKADKDGHLPSRYKDDLHPNRYIKQDGGYYDTKHEMKATAKDVYVQGLTRAEREKRMKK
jgi:hypothetical protein